MHKQAVTTLPTQSPELFVHWFRQAGPYINAHRGKTFVLLFSGEAVEAHSFASLIHDIALLHALDIRLVLIHGARHQIEEHLRQAGRVPRYAQGLRITEAEDLPLVKQVVGRLRIGIEARISMGLANSPMQGAKLRVISGNFISARPLGVRDGIDYGFTGEVRRIDAAAIRLWLEQPAIVLLSPLGYSPTGEIFNLSAAAVATATAIALQADKLLIFSEGTTLHDPVTDQPIRELSLHAAQQLLTAPGAAEQNRHCLQSALHACQAGVRRVHILNRALDGALLLELFTRDGVGALITADIYEGLRPATIEDVGGLLELIKPLEEDGTLVRRSRELLEVEIERFILLERDCSIIGCAALYPFPAEKLGELACVAVHPNYRNQGRADALLSFIERQAQDQGLQRLFVLTTRTAHWFRERGFEAAAVSDLPVEKQELYNWQRRSQVFIKPISAN